MLVIRFQMLDMRIASWLFEYIFYDFKREISAKYVFACYNPDRILPCDSSMSKSQVSNFPNIFDNILVLLFCLYMYSTARNSFVAPILAGFVFINSRIREIMESFHHWNALTYLLWYVVVYIKHKIEKGTYGVYTEHTHSHWQHAPKVWCVFFTALQTPIVGCKIYKVYCTCSYL